MAFKVFLYSVSKWKAIYGTIGTAGSPNEVSLDKKKVSEYDQEIPQSQTADNPMAPRGRAAQPSRDTRKTN